MTAEQKEDKDNINIEKEQNAMLCSTHDLFRCSRQYVLAEQSGMIQPVFWPYLRSIAEHVRAATHPWVLPAWMDGLLTMSEEREKRKRASSHAMISFGISIKRIPLVDFLVEPVVPSFSSAKNDESDFLKKRPEKENK